MHGIVYRLRLAIIILYQYIYKYNLDDLNAWTYFLDRSIIDSEASFRSYFRILNIVFILQFSHELLRFVVLFYSRQHMVISVGAVVV